MSKTILTLVALLCLLVCNATPADSSIASLVEESGIKTGPTAMRDWPSWRPPSKIVLRTSDDFASDLRSEFPSIEFVVVSSIEDAIAEASDADAIVGFCSAKLLKAAARATWIQF